MTGLWIALSGLAFVWAISSQEWKVLLRSEVISSVFGGVIALGFAWNMKAVLPGMSAEALVGLSFQFFGASLLVAMYGLRPAIVMLAVVTSIVALVSGWALEEAFRQYLILGVLPAFVAAGSMRCISRYLPKHLFIFILGHGYVSGVVSVIIPGVVMFSLHQMLIPASTGLSMDVVDWLVTLIILSFTEGSLSGMMLAIFVVYKPHWVPRFSDQEYLRQASTAP